MIDLGPVQSNSHVSAGTIRTMSVHVEIGHTDRGRGGVRGLARDRARTRSSSQIQVAKSDVSSRIGANKHEATKRQAQIGTQERLNIDRLVLTDSIGWASPPDLALTEGVACDSLHQIFILISYDVYVVEHRPQPLTNNASVHSYFSSGKKSYDTGEQNTFSPHACSLSSLRRNVACALLNLNC